MATASIKPWIAQKIEDRFGGFRQQANRIDPTLPRKLDQERTVAVIGGGIAGFTAAIELARRGYTVSLFERNTYLGGKLGSWQETIGQGDDAQDVWVDHGFHAFFRHYYNFNRLLDSLDLRKGFIPIDDYMIIEQSGQRLGFKDVDTTPILNMISMAQKGLFSWKDLIFSPAMRKLDPFLRYDPGRTFANFDDTSFEDFDRQAKLPTQLRLAFNTFSRAFFSDADRMSLAELIKSFHFYYLGHDHGLLYDYPTGNYQDTILGPMVEHLTQHGASIHTGQGVDTIERDEDGFRVHGQRFDRVVLATDVVGTRAILSNCPWIHEHPAWADRITRLRPAQRYAVWRVWMDRDMGHGLPHFISTERFNALDSVTFYHHYEKDCRDWAQKSGGGIYELHSYALPDHLVEPEAIRQALLADLVQ